MKYALKDRDLQKKLDDISGGDFTKSLQKAVRPKWSHLMFDVPFRRAGKNTKRYEAYFFLDEIEEIEEIPAYDPNKWNVWPDTNPPEGKLMRVEMYEPAEHDGPEYKPEKVHYRLCAIYEHGWRYCYGSNALIQRTQNLRIRYRPWED